MSARVTLKDHMGGDHTVVNCARVSFGKSVDLLGEKDARLIRYLAREGALVPVRSCDAPVPRHQSTWLASW